jgi:signal transduction histidine kinase
LQSRGIDGAGGWLASACRLILNVRAGILLVTLISLSQAEHRELTAAAIIVAAGASIVPVLRWEQVGPAIVRHPSYLAGELVLAALILILTGVDSPFFFFTLGTALLGGLVYGYPGAGLFSFMLIVVYAYAVHVRAGANIDDANTDFRTVVVLPALYPLVAVAGAGARRLLDRQAEAEEALADQERTLAAQAERERLARDMHDSLAKTVHGIGFAALALSRRIRVDPVGAEEDARKLAEDARTAAQEARELLSGLRGRDDSELPLPTAIRSEAARWGERTGTRVGGSLDDVGPLPSLALRELRWILKEALANVERYANATRVNIHLRRLGDRVTLTIADDGVGFEAPDDLESLAGVSSFGLAGMRERARLAGGDLSVESEPGDGCVISAWVPAGAPARQPEGPEPPPAAPASGSVPGGAVEGYTWQ